eukprot:4580519-Pyramimonas_sp.AAC.1
MALVVLLPFTFSFAMCSANMLYSLARLPPARCCPCALVGPSVSVQGCFDGSWVRLGRLGNVSGSLRYVGGRPRWAPLVAVLVAVLEVVMRLRSLC